MNKFFINYLDINDVEDDLRKVFGKFGELADVLVARQGVRPRGFGFVTYRDGIAAIANGVLSPIPKVINGHQVEVKLATPKSEYDDANQTNRMVIEGVPSTATEASLERYFAQFADVQSVAKEQGGIAHITFKTVNDFEIAFRVPHHSIEGQQIITMKYNPKAAKKYRGHRDESGHERDFSSMSAPTPGCTDNSNPKCKIFVGGLLLHTDHTALYEYFSEFGPIEAVEVKYDPKGNSRKFGFVVFEEPTTVLSVLQNQFHTIQGKQVEAKAVVTREQINTEAAAALARGMPVPGFPPPFPMYPPPYFPK